MIHRYRKEDRPLALLTMIAGVMTGLAFTHHMVMNHPWLVP
jgi:hypothetical protein